MRVWEGGWRADNTVHHHPKPKSFAFQMGRVDSKTYGLVSPPVKGGKARDDEFADLSGISPIFAADTRYFAT